MHVELITKQEAFKRYAELKDIAFAISEANGTLPGYCTAPECKLFVACAGLATELKEGDVCIFIDGKPADQITDFLISPGQYFIGKICANNVSEVFANEALLSIQYHDGVIELYDYIEEIGAYKFKSKNISINVPSFFAN